MEIRAARPDDAGAIARIYNHYVRETIITFEEVEIDAGEMARRMATVMESYPWLVGEEGGAVVGYAYGGKYNERSAYRHSVLTSIYLDAPAVGQGRGTRLYGALLQILRARSLHTALGGISLPNPQSIALHEKLGFRKFGQVAEVGYKFGRWIDVGYWQVML